MKGWIRFALLMGAVVLAAELFGRSRSRPPPNAPGSDAPDFTLPALDGRKLTLSQLRGRVVVVNFWATWCSPCKLEIPDFRDVYAARKGQCVEFLGVTEESGTPDEVAAMARELGINYPVLLDDDGAVGEAFRIPAYPRTVLVDARGKVRRIFEGVVSKPELEEALAPLLTETRAGCPKQG